MTTEESWALTPREFQARAQVREVYQAMWRMETRNAPHFTKKGGKAWTVGDFMAEAPEMRELNVKQRQQEEKDKLDLALMQRRLALMRPGEPPPNLPEWAVGPYWKDREEC
jgi:hypothetical protein